MCESQGERHVNDGKPNVAGYAVEDTSDLGFDARQTRQLPVYAVENIGKNEQQDTK